MTLTQTTFVLCGLVIGPAYGVWATKYIGQSNNGFIKKAAVFLLGLNSAYLGWGISGLIGMRVYPEYPYNSPGEFVSMLFTVPGFITGTVGVFCVFKWRIKLTPPKIALAVLPLLCSNWLVLILHNQLINQ